MKNISNDLGLLILRLTAGGLMALNHGWPKLANFNNMLGSFPDPIGLGSGLSLSMAVFAEFFCAILIVLGVFTRFAAIPIAFTMLVAAFVVHWSDPWAKKEMALLFFGMYLTLICLGGGKFSILKSKAMPSS